MTSQPPLLDPSGADIPSPMFTPRPGWGGRLRAWLRDNFYVLLFRLIVLVAVLLIISSLIRAWKSAPVVVSPSPTPSSQNWTFETATEPGQGMTHLAAWAVDAYATQHDPQIELTAVEHLFAVDALARLTGWRSLERGEEVQFSADDIAVIITRAQSLSPAQRSAWAKLLRKFD